MAIKTIQKKQIVNTSHLKKKRNTNKKVIIAKVKKKDIVTLKKFIIEDLLFFRHDVKNIYKAFYSLYMSDAP